MGFFYASPSIMDLWQSGKSPNEYSTEDEFANVQGMTVYYWTLVLGQIAAAISTTTKLQSVFGFCGEPYGFRNRALNTMFAVELLLGVAAIYIPFMQQAFETLWLPVPSLLLPIGALVAICIIEEVR